MPAIVCNASFHSTTCPKKPNSIQNACFKGFRETRFELAVKLQTEKLPDDFQDAEYLAGFQFREEFLLLQIKCDLLVAGQDPTYSFRGARNREDAAQRLQSFVHWKVSFEETFHSRFAVLALMSTGFAIDQNHIGFL
jgi:hypothetical protein